jgi:hypothetical protein
MMGNGFALRLATAELRAMGGSLRRDGARLVVLLPRASADDAASSTDASSTGRAAPSQAG